MAADLKRIEIKVTTDGESNVKKLADSFDRLGRTVRKTSSDVSFISGAFKSFIAGFAAQVSLRSIANMSDEFQLLRDRLKTTTGSAEDAKQTFKDIAAVAAATNTPIANIASAFNRFAISTKELGLNSRQTLGIVTALQQSFRITGASIQEQDSALVQLSQAFSLGRLQGQELRSVLLSNAVAAKLLAKEFGVNVGQLKALGEQGKLTTDRVIKALTNGFEDLNKQASGLRITISQGLLQAFDQMKLKVDELNNEFDIAGNLNKGIKFLIENFNSLTIIIGGFVAARYLPILATQIIAVGTALTTGGLGAFLASTPKIKLLTLALTGIAVAYEKFLSPRSRTKDSVASEIKSVEESILSIQKRLSKPVFTGFQKELKGKLSIELDELKEKLKLLKIEFSSLGGPTGSILKKLQDDSENIELTSTSNEVFNLAEAIKKLNLQFLSRGNVSEYNSQLSALQLKDLNNQFKEGKINLESFTKSYQDLILKSSDANSGLFASFGTGFRIGLEQVQSGIGTVSEQVAGATKNAFRAMEDDLVNFVKNGKLEFKSLANSIVEDLARIAIRQQITGPLANAFSGLFNGGAAPATGNNSISNFQTPGTRAAAKGGVFGSNVKAFASGGILDQPTFFPMKGGRTGLAGEAGAEAIIPLKRNRNGDLGVSSSGGSTVVNIVNNSSGQIQSNESQDSNGNKQIDIVIVDTVNRAIGDGRLDQTFSSTYGIRRKGR